MKKIFILICVLIICSSGYSQKGVAQIDDKSLNERQSTIDNDIRIKQITIVGSLSDSVDTDSMIVWIGNSQSLRFIFYQDTVNANGFRPATNVEYNKNVINKSFGTIYYIDSTFQYNTYDSMFYLTDTTSLTPLPFVSIDSDDSVNLIGVFQKFNTTLSVSGDTLGQYLAVKVSVDDTERGDLSDRIIDWILLIILYAN